MTAYQRIRDGGYKWHWKECDKIEIVEIYDTSIVFKDLVLNTTHTQRLREGRFGKYFNYGTTYYIERNKYCKL